MHLDRLTVRQFRNIASAELDLLPGINVLWGSNAQGKTNLLEAVHFLVTGRSFRTNRERQCLPADMEEGDAALIRGRVVREDGAHAIQVGLQAGKRRIEIDGAPIAKLGMLWGKLNAVLFTPDDLQIVKGPPDLRRRFLDEAISQIRPSYLSWLQRYTQIRRERTELLRQIAWGRASRDELDVWDRTLAEAATEVHGHRRDVIARLSALAGGTHTAVTESAERLHLVHRSFLETSEPLTRDACIKRCRALLLDARDSDLERLQTTVGPHRDDILISINDQLTRDFGSQGQQRATILALRLAQMALMEEETGESPILLLDDIISELDPERRRRFFQLLRPDVQALVTTVEDPRALEEIPVERVFQVHGGQFSPVEAVLPAD